MSTRHWVCSSQALQQLDLAYNALTGPLSNLLTLPNLLYVDLGQCYSRSSSGNVATCYYENKNKS